MICGTAVSDARDYLMIHIYIFFFLCSYICIYNTSWTVNKTSPADCRDIGQAPLIMTLAINEVLPNVSLLPHLSSFASSLRALEETTTWHFAWVKAKGITGKKPKSLKVRHVSAGASWFFSSASQLLPCFLPVNKNTTKRCHMTHIKNKDLSWIVLPSRSVL